MAPAAEVAVQLPESKLAVESISGTMSGPLVGGSGGGATAAMRPFGRKAEVMHVLLWLICIITSVAALSFMVTAQQSSSISIYGFTLPVQSKWSFSHSFQYLAGVCAAVAAHSLLQLLISMSRLLRKSPVIPSRSHAWLLFAGDQVFAYAMVSAGAAASGVTNLNRTGIHHTALPDFCKPLRTELL
ncbi:NITRATE FORMATE IRON DEHYDROGENASE [Salix koriyanagi]|uniref:CASP-like protein n=1 Tax=Salix koriyanagi TaxID=2511006 RepID=A0A9Q0PY28_9ROSI|nr:NITRATE FORMATE IRON DEHYDROGENASE [Salix koriyanagi]